MHLSVTEKLDRVLGLLATIHANQILAKDAAMALKDTVDTLKADVAAQVTVVASVKALLAGLALEIKALSDRVIDPQTQADLAGIQQAIEASSAELAAAVAATPAPTPAPAPAPAPAPTPVP